MKRIVIASSNPGKLREFRSMCGPLGMEIIPQSELGIGDAEEPHLTFVENALAKARHASGASGLPAFADDSGICVAALDGAPGVHSARFAAPMSDAARSAAVAHDRDTQDARNNAKLVAALADKPDRRAHYTCVMVLLHAADDPEPLIAEGHWHGEIIDTPRGDGGFGYDPHFYLPHLGVTAAELPAEEKNKISHRGLALAQLMQKLRRQKHTS